MQQGGSSQGSSSTHDLGLLSERLGHAMLQSPSKSPHKSNGHRSVVRRALWQSEEQEKSKDELCGIECYRSDGSLSCDDDPGPLCNFSGGWCLPTDVMSIIAAYLSRRDLKSSRLVCSEWYRSISKALIKLQPRAISSAMQCLRFQGLQELDLSRCRWLRDESVIGIENLTTLRRLRLDGCDGLTDKAIESVAALNLLASLSLRQLSKITDISLWLICRSIENLSRRSFPASPGVSPRLHRTDHHSKVSPSCWQQMVSKLGPPPPLRSLDVSGCTLLTEHGFGCLHKALPFLEELHVGGISRVATVNNESLSMVGRLRSLQTLDMSGCSSATNNGLRTFTNLRNLRKLNLWNCLRLNSSAIQNLVLCTSLEELSFRGCSLIDDPVVQYLQALTSLRVLDFRACENLRGERLHRLSTLNQLTYLSCRGCYALSDAGLASLASLKTLKRLHVSLLCNFIPYCLHTSVIISYLLGLTLE